MVPKENTCILQKTTCICRKLQKIVAPFITHPLIKGGTSQKKIHMFIQNWRRKCTKANLYDYRGTNPNHDRKKGLRIRFGGLKINNCLAFKCCITLKEKCDFKLLTFGFVNKLSELADSNFCWNRFLTKLSEHTTYQLKYNASSFHPQILCWKC